MLRATLSGPDLEDEELEVTLPYLAGRQKSTVTFVFGQEPGRGQLEIVPVGFVSP